MTLDAVTVWLERAAAVIPAVLAVAAAVLAARQQPRLRREEEMWRQVLETSPDLAPAKELHRHVSAQLMAQHLTPGATPGTRVMMVFGVVLGAGGGILGAVVAADPGWSEQHQLALLLTLVLLGGGVTFLGVGLDELTGALDARHRAARQILGDPVDARDRKIGFWNRAGQLSALSAGGMAIVAGVCGAFWGMGWTFAVGMPYPVIAMVSLAVYLLGMGTGGVTWRRLVTRPPDPPPIPGQGQPDRPALADSEVKAGDPAGAGRPDRQNVPMWRLGVGMALTTAAARLLRGRRT